MGCLYFHFLPCLYILNAINRMCHDFHANDNILKGKFFNY